MIIIPKLKLGYQNIPKVATTSLFSWLHHFCGKGEAEKEKARKYFLSGENSVVQKNTLEDVHEYKDYFKFSITRDPVKRFLSMYSNRVVFHRELSAQSKCAHRLEQAGLVFDPQLNELVENLESYLGCAQTILHHTRPMMDFLGPDLSVYGRIADIGEVAKVIDEIKMFWAHEGMNVLVETAPANLARKQTGGPKLGLNALTPDSFECLLEYYREDYENIPTISLQEIKSQYIEARDEIGDGEPVIFQALKQKTTTQQNKELSQHSPQLTSHRVSVKKESSSMIESLKLNIPRSFTTLNESFVLNGAAILQSKLLSNEWALVLSDGVDERTIKWGLPSPKLSSKFPDNPSANNARFRLSSVQFKMGHAINIFLQRNEGERHLLASIQLNA
jgi:hypothetical protein